MADLLSILTSDVLPVFAIAGAGYLLARLARASVTTVSHVAFYVALPCLVFRLLVTSSHSAPIVGRLVVVAVLMTAAMGLVGFAVAKSLRLDRPSLRAFLIVVMFSNVGNYGLPVVTFAFGPDALAYATIVFLTGSVLTYTVGAFLAAGAHGNATKALLKVVKMPALYGVALAGLVIATGTTVPTAVMRPVSLLADSALPIMILVLGMQLERASWPARPVVTLAAVAVSLVISPLVGLGLAAAFDLTGAARQAAVVLGSMPVAVSTTILALEFDLDPNFVTSTVWVSTLVSPFTLTPLIAYLK